MNIRQIEYVLAVAEHRHFELASEKCFISQSTLSTMISKYEEEIGIIIFDRKKKPVETTSEGQLIIQQMKIIQKQLDELEELQMEIKGETRGEISISVIPTIAPFLLPMFLQNFAYKFPELKITVKEQTTEEIIRKIKIRELDIGIISIPVKEKEIIEIKLYDEPFVLFDLGIKGSKIVNPKKIDFSNMWLMEEGHCMRTQVAEICDLNKKNKKNQSNLDFKAGSIDSLLRFVKSNQAKTLLPYLAIQNFSEKEKIHVHNFESPVPMREVGLVVHEHFAKKKVLNLVKQDIIENVSSLIPLTKQKGKAISPV
ncbi:MAG: LysR substrate-binding domain-containing protein [Bacteroidota bacterium]|jgi:LysR family hydrogen peroxide-inducible transcriptional activator